MTIYFVYRKHQNKQLHKVHVFVMSARQVNRKASSRGFTLVTLCFDAYDKQIIQYLTV